MKPREHPRKQHFMAELVIRSRLVILPPRPRHQPAPRGVLQRVPHTQRLPALVGHGFAHEIEGVLGYLLSVLDNLPVIPAAPQQDRPALVVQGGNQHPALRNKVDELKRLGLIETVVPPVHVLQFDLRGGDTQRLRTPPGLKGVNAELVGAAF